MQDKKRSGRPKGSLQKKRNESKYWLPVGVRLADGNPSIYNKETRLLFIDESLGEFISYFKALQDANASTHPEAIKQRRAATNKTLYGHNNAGSNPEIIQKRKKTMVERYGAWHPLQSEEIKARVKQTVRDRYGVDYNLQSEEIKANIKKTNLEKYGVSVASKHPEVVNKAKQTSLKNWGYDNASKSPIIKERILKSFEDRGYRSKGETELAEYVESLGFDVKCGGYFGGTDPLQVDIKIPSVKVGIEYHGMYWHSTDKVGSNYHVRKYNSAKLAGYRLIQIFEHEWSNRQQQVKSFLRSALGKNTRIVAGRKTEVRKVGLHEAKIFLNEYHILGSPVYFKDAYGLYTGDELLALVTVNKHHRTSSEDVLTRYCGKYNVTVQGGLSKLCKAVIADYPEVSTFIDLRMSNGENWLKLGWELVGQVKPDYFYYDPKVDCVVKKQSMTRQNSGRQAGVTEKQEAITRGYLKLYDCGKLKLRYRHNNGKNR